MPGIVPIIVALLGAPDDKPRLAELGRIMFWCGTAALCWVYARA